MADINSVTLVGRLTRDAELKYTGGGTAVCSFSVAVNRRVKKGDTWEDQASFIDVALWGKAGEAVSQYLKKGKQVGVSGELRQERWTDNSGGNRSKIVISAHTVQLLGGRDTADGGSGPSSGTAHDPGQSFSGDPGFDDDIPF